MAGILLLIEQMPVQGWYFENQCPKPVF